jgi:beta-phosphoglucomutase-like phosphatase (HAD superfamily)
MMKLGRALHGAKAVIFDCDGTLIDSLPVYERAWTEGFAIGGGRMANDWYRARNGLSEHVLLDAFEETSGLKFDRKQVVSRMRDAYLENMESLSEISVVANIARKSFGKLRMAVASGGPAAIVLPSLRHLQLDTLFDVIVTLDDVGVPKPAPDLFIEAARRLNSKPADCVVLEDSDQGVTAAGKAGMRCIDVRRLTGPPPPHSSSSKDR